MRFALASRMRRFGTRSLRYALVGAALGTGAPVGLFVLRRLFAPKSRIASDRLVYGYLAITTPSVFALFGAILGAVEDKRRALSQRMNEMREEHDAVIAHDLRNPINTILLQSQTILRQATDEGVLVDPNALQRIKRSANRLNDMVAHLLDVTQLELAKVELDRKPIDLATVVPALIERMRPVLGAHPTEVSIAKCPLHVFADSLRLEEILTNLIDNAAKYSPEAAPIVVELRSSEEGAIISVRDRGIGIAQDELPRLFDRYYQAKRAREKKSGLGLGLYITKGLVEAHHGKLWVESAPGRGSTFFVWLPASEALQNSKSPGR